MEEVSSYITNAEILEPLNDTTITTPVLRIIVDTPQASPLSLHRHSYLLNFPPLLHSGVTPLTPSQWSKTYRTEYSAFASGVQLPPNIHLLSFKALNSGSNKFILRLTHVFAVGEDDTFSAPTTVDIGELFSSSFTIKSFQKTTLTANQQFEDSPLTVSLSPKEIYTFLIEL